MECSETCVVSSYSEGTTSASQVEGSQVPYTDTDKTVDK